MSKGILCVDIPNNCKECQYRQCSYVDYCIVDHHTITGIEPYEKRPSECPIKPFPGKKKYTYNNLQKDSEVSGWNACIDEMEQKMLLICDLNSPCPSQKTMREKDICTKEEGECEYQRLEEQVQCAKDKCAWCKIDVDTQPQFKAESWPEKKCSRCGSWNDIGQHTITMNSMKQIYEGCLKLMQYVAETCGEILVAADIDFDEIKETLDMDKNKPLSIDVGTWQIVKMLFLIHGSSGGTSTGNLTYLLGLQKESVSFLLEKYKMCTNTECPYYKGDEICEAIEGCAGYEGADEI